MICPAFTFFATAEAIARRGATPVFADIDPATLNLDPNRGRARDHRADEGDHARPPVRPAGADRGAARASGCRSIEDAAQAFGSHGIATSVVSTFSFFPSKNLFALGDGGLIAVNDAELAERIRMLRFHGSRAKKDFEYVGYNSRLDAIQAAALRIFLPHLDEWTRLRREAAARYAELGLGEIAELPQDEPGHVYHMYAVRTPERDRLAAALDEAGIAHASHYTTPLHLQPALRYLGYSEGDLPETEKAGARQPLPAAVGRHLTRAAGARRRRAPPGVEPRHRA